MSELLRERFVPVALDAWYQIRGSAFFAHVALQRPDLRGRVRRSAPDEQGRVRLEAEGLTTQGYYVFTPCGRLLAGWTLLDSNERDSERLRAILQQVLERYRPCALDERLPAAPSVAPRAPEGATAVTVFARLSGARYASPADRWTRIYRESVGQDVLWVLPEEVARLAAGEVPPALVRRIARFHLVDTSRAEPRPWTPAQVHEATLQPGDDGWLVGRARLGDEERGFAPALRGRVVVREGRLERFDLVAAGPAHGRLAADYKAEAPEGEFELELVLTLTPAGRRPPPYGARWGEDYLAPR